MFGKDTETTFVEAFSMLIAFLILVVTTMQYRMMAN